MKLNQICDELIDLVKQSGYTVRRENGSFRSGDCLLNNEKLIIINRSTPLETISRVLALTVAEQRLDGVFIKPAVREFIEKETAAMAGNTAFKLQVDY